jgi:putative nucleotidyltransferase with HDIG domain
MLALKSRTRRAEIRRARPEAPRFDWEKWREDGVLASLAVALAFFVCATSILMYRQDVVPYRPGQWIPHDIVSRVRFSYFDKERLAMQQFEARDREPRVYKPAGDVWGDLRKALVELPERVANSSQQLPADLKTILDPGTETVLRRYATSPDRDKWARSVDAYVRALREYPITAGGKSWPLVILSEEDRKEDVKARRDVRMGTEGLIDAARTIAARSEDLRAILQKAADDNFMLALQPKVVDFSLATLGPTHVLDLTATDDAKNEAAALIPASAGERNVPVNEPFVPKSKGVFDAQDWNKMKAENQKYVSSLRGSNWKGRLGTALLVFIVTLVLSAYVAVYQPKVVKNQARAVGIAALLLAMLLLTQMTGLGNGPLYLLGIAPTVLVAMILAIAYEQRFAVGIASMHGMLGTVALQQGVTFFMVIWVGVLTACFFLSDIRTRSKLIEIGGGMAIAMMAATVAAGFMGFDPWRFVMQNALYAGAAGLAVGFIVLGILPFIEKAFRITTSMTLLELADASQPLLRRLQVEAPGTYNHSLQVATLAETAAEAIGANSLLCRVGSYYHDVGKIHKADYFVENQGNGENRHLNLNPSVSLLVIIGHVKDGVEMAKEYNLPTSLVPFIQQHHGTTLVEYFYHQACKKEQPDQPAVSEMQYRYPGPKPRSREVAIVMLADACESACRALAEPTAGRVEGLVHDLTMKRLLDGQFDECDITMRELEQVERSIVKALIGIYHGRIQYPSTAALMATTPAAPPAPTAVRSA